MDPSPCVPCSFEVIDGYSFECGHFIHEECWDVFVNQDASTCHMSFTIQCHYKTESKMTQPEENNINRTHQPAQPEQESSLPASSVPGLHHTKGKAADLVLQDSLAYGPLSFQGTLKHGWSTWGSGLHCTSQESLHAKEVAVPSHHINTSDQCTTPHPAWGHGFAENCSTEPYTKSSSEAILAESSSSDEALKRNPSSATLCLGNYIHTYIHEVCMKLCPSMTRDRFWER